MATLLEAVPADGHVVIESTANGIGNYFHTLWRAAADKQSEFKPHFFPWWLEPKYRLEPTDEEFEAWQSQLGQLGVAARR